MIMRLVPRPPAPEPRIELIEVCWRITGLSGRMLTCGIYRTDVGLEVRCGYDEDLIRSEYAGDVITARAIANEWRQAVLAKSGFTEVPAT